MGEAALEVGSRCALAVGQNDRDSKLAAAAEQISHKSEYRDDPQRTADNIAHIDDFLARWTSRGKGLVRPFVHTWSVIHNSEEMFHAGYELAKRHDTGMMTHINRDREEVELSVALYGRRPIEHLSAIGALGPGLLAIRAMQTTPREIALLATAGAALAHSPVACTAILTAITDVVGMRTAGITVGLGCDTVINDILKVMRIAFFMHGQAAGSRFYDPIAFTTEDAFETGPIDAARALLWDREISSIEIGKAADIAVVDGENLRLSPPHSPVGVLVRYATGTDVKSVLVNGPLVVDDWELLTIDEKQLLEDADDVATRLRDDLASRRYWPLTQRTRLI